LAESAEEKHDQRTPRAGLTCFETNSTGTCARCSSYTRSSSSGASSSSSPSGSPSNETLREGERALALLRHDLPGNASRPVVRRPAQLQRGASSARAADAVVVALR